MGAQNRVKGNPIEAGNVDWGRDLDTALQESKASKKPVLVLFQEIPGCIGCRTFGSEVLTHPLLVEAIETLFIPVLVYNNRAGGKDQEWLERYREPAWNYQVIRFLGSDGKDLIPRKDRVWTIDGVTSRMVVALQQAGRPVPQYLKALQLEFDTDNHAQIGFAMACFWTGEYYLGKADGVIATEAGWYDNREITLVTYHRKQIEIDALIDYAASVRCAQRVYPPPGVVVDKRRFEAKALRLEKYRLAKPSDQKKQLERWPEVHQIEGLTAMQQVKLNSFLPDDKKRALQWLSPRQVDQLKNLQ